MVVSLVELATFVVFIVGKIENKNMNHDFIY